jgi:hypothetical protein
LVEVAAFTLTRWRRFKPYLEAHPEAWRPILAQWPAEVVRLLPGMHQLGFVGRLAAEGVVEAAADGLIFQQGEVCTMFGTWQVVRRLDPLAGPMARRLWDWLAPPRARLKLPENEVDRLPQEHPLEILQNLSRGNWPHKSCLLIGGEYKSTTPASELADFLRSGAITLGDTVLDDLWIQAERSWCLKLLLLLFPDHDFTLDWLRLGLLVPVADWLRSHLCRLPESQRQIYALATYRFHSQPYGGKSGPAWQPEMQNTPLWALFKGVPFELQGSLHQALDSYGKSPAERAGLAKAYIKAFSGEENLRRARRRVLEEFLLPVLSGRDHDEKLRRLDRRQIIDLVRLKEKPDKLVETTRRGVDFERERRGAYYVARGEGPYLGIRNDGKGVVIDEALWELVAGMFGKGGYLLSEQDLEKALEKLGI